MLKQSFIAAVFLAAPILGENNEFLRDLQAAPSITQTASTATSYSSTTRALKFYGDDIRI